MKKYLLGVIFGAFSLSFSPWLLALGLGGITTDSALNEPLIAEIELINVGDLENREILVGIGTDSDYALADVTREYFHTRFQFEVQAEGVGTPRILLRTQEPITDPYVNFIVQIRWPQGRLLREYTVLLDMPVFSKQESTSVNNQPQQAAAPQTARQASEQQATRQQAPAAQPRAISRARTNVSQSNIASGGDYQVSQGDTLWSLAGDLSAGSGVSRYQAMLAIHEQNIDAFNNGNINQLKAGALLRMPSQAQMSDRSANQSFRDFSAMSAEAGATPLSAVDNSFRNAGDATQAEQGGRLSLTSPQDGVSAVGQADQAALAEQQEALSTTLEENAVLKEELDAAAIQNQELEDRIANLEEQLELSQQLIEESAAGLESEELAVAQEAQLAEEELTPPVPVQPPETFIDRLMGFLPWILVGLAVLVVIALIVVLLVLKRRNSVQHDELLVDDDYTEEAQFVAPLVADDDDDLDEDDEYLDDEELEDDDDFGEIAKNLSEESLDEIDDFGEVSEEESDDESESAESFEDAEEEDDVFENDEFDDLDEFFSDDSSEAKNMLFGDDDALDPPAEDQENDDSELEDDELQDDSDINAGVTFSASGFDTSDASDETDDAVDAEEIDAAADETSLEFDISDYSPDKGEEIDEILDEEIDLENSFDYTEAGISEDLGADAEAEFADSLELHTPEMEDLLVPPSDSEDGIDIDPNANSFENAELEEELEVDEDLLEDELDVEIEAAADSASLDIDEDLNLDEGMDADLGDLDLEDVDLEAADGDEEFITQLELAEAYIEMGDVQGARELLSEVEKDGNDEQKAAAKALLQSAQE